MRKFTASNAFRMPLLASWIVSRSAEEPSVLQSRSTGLRTPDGPRFSSWIEIIDAALVRQAEPTGPELMHGIADQQRRPHGRSLRQLVLAHANSSRRLLTSSRSTGDPGLSRAAQKQSATAARIAIKLLAEYIQIRSKPPQLRRSGFQQ